MTTVIFGGAGFIGLTIAEAMLRDGESVLLFDRNPLPATARAAFDRLPGRYRALAGDVADRHAVAAAIATGTDAVIMGAAITADAARDAREPGRILETNLVAGVGILERARDAGVRRVVNLSSAAAYGATGNVLPSLAETAPCEPQSLYAVTKFASERVVARLAGLWARDLVSVRLSAVFGPWEYATGLRDTLSPLIQIADAARCGEAALLPRPGFRDWTYAPDVAAAIRGLVAAPPLRHGLYNISSGTTWSALDWGRAYAAHHPGFACRLAEAGETPTIDLHGAQDRAPMLVERLRAETGWRAAYGCDASAAHLARWRHTQETAGSDA